VQIRCYVLSQSVCSYTENFSLLDCLQQTTNQHHTTSQSSEDIKCLVTFLEPGWLSQYHVWAGGQMVVMIPRSNKRSFTSPKHYASLTFRGLCIVIYSYNKSQQDALFLNFILVKNSTCFGQIYGPSSGVSILYSQQ
jgi:hypothetical protein